jgi:hypothetical protein
VHLSLNFGLLGRPFIFLVVLVCAAGCVHQLSLAEPPLLRLSPQSLEREWVAQQALSLTAKGPARYFQAALEVDAHAVRLALLSLGQTAASLHWDGVQLTESRASWLPAQVSFERVLSDLQLVFWPAQAIAQALPAGWSLRVEPQERSVCQGDEIVIQVRYGTTHSSAPNSSAAHAHLVHKRLGYQLSVQSMSASEP